MKTKNVVVSALVALSMTVSAFASEPVSSKLVVLNPKAGIFKVIYEGAKAGKVSMKITDQLGNQLFAETIRSISGFSRPVNFDGMAEGTYTIEIPENLKPALLNSQTGGQARWLSTGQIVWLSGGLPGSISATPSAATPSATTAPTSSRSGGRSGGGSGSSSSGGYRFTAYQEIDPAKKHQAAFDMCWRTMRDRWYDERLGNRDWNAIRAKYLPMADTTDPEKLTTVIQLIAPAGAPAFVAASAITSATRVMHRAAEGCGLITMGQRALSEIRIL